MTRVVLLLCMLVAYAVQMATGRATEPPSPVPMPPASLFESSKIYSGVVGVDDLGDTESCPSRPYSKRDAEKRERIVKVSFGRTFYQPPGVTYSVTWLHTDNDHNLRYNVEITEITTKDFTIVFKTWCRTRITSIKVTYWVFGATTCGASFATA